MSERGKNRVFLAYANYSLREDPKNFFKIYDVFDRSHSSRGDIIYKKDLRTQVEAIIECEFSKKAFVESVISRKPDPNVRVIYAADMHLTNAIEALYGYRDGFCEYECPVRNIREEKWGRKPFEGSDRLKCTECDQCDFVRVLIDIMDEITYSEIDGLLPQPARKFLAEMFDPHPVPGRFPNQSRDPHLSVDEESWKFGFRRHWNTLIGTDLEGFLNEDESNWRRLKLCPYCSEFFTATSVAREICYSQDCGKAYQREQKRPYMQRKRDPESPEYDQRYKTREFTKKKPT